jgi:hypothetical protein
MAIEAMGPLGDGVFDHVEQMPVVGGPGGRGDPFGAEGQQVSGAEIFDFQRVLAEPGGVGRIGEEMVIVGDFKRTEAQKGMAPGESIQVEEDVVGGVGRAGRSAQVERILLALDGFGGVEVVAQTIRDGQVGLLDAGEHLLVQGFLKGFGGLQGRLRCRRFRLRGGG